MQLKRRKQYRNPNKYDCKSGIGSLCLLSQRLVQTYRNGLNAEILLKTFTVFPRYLWQMGNSKRLSSSQTYRRAGNVCPPRVTFHIYSKIRSCHKSIPSSARFDVNNYNHTLLLHSMFCNQLITNCKTNAWGLKLIFRTSIVLLKKSYLCYFAHCVAFFRYQFKFF